MLKNAKLSEDTQLDLYAAHAKMNLDQFRDYCVEVVSGARVPNQQIIRSLPTMTKDKALMSTNNFIMKGHGMGVR